MKRLLVLFLILTVSASLFAGGGGGQQQPAAAGAQQTIVNVTPRPLTVTPQYGPPERFPQPATYYRTNPRFPNQPPISNINGFPIVQQPYTIRLAHQYYSYVLDYETNDLVLYMEELTGVKVEWDLLPEVGHMDRVNLMFASGERLPDAFFGVTGFTSAMLITLGEGGLIIPIDDIVFENAYNYGARVELEPGIWPATTMANGRVYSMGTAGLPNPNQHAMRFWINQPFLDALGMQMPRTTEEYYQYLVGVRDRNPNGLGPSVQEIPMIADIEVWHGQYDGFLMNAFIINNTSNFNNPPAQRRRMFLTERGEIDVSYTKPEWRQGIEYMHRLYSEGLMAPEVFSLTRAGVIALVENPAGPIVGSLPQGGPHEFANTGGERRTHYRVVPPLRGPNGVQWAFFDEFNTLGLGSFFITRDADAPELLIKWNDYWFTPDMSTRNRYGVLGRDWLIPPEGTIGVTGGPAMYEEILRWGTPQNAYIGRGVGSWGTFGSQHRALSPDPFELEFVLYNAYVAYQPYRFERNVPSMLPFTVEEARDFTMLNTNIIEYMEQTMAQFVTGRLAINDANWNNYLQTIDRLGLAQLLNVTQNAFDRGWAETLGYRR